MRRILETEVCRGRVAEQRIQVNIALIDSAVIGSSTISSKAVLSTLDIAVQKVRIRLGVQQIHLITIRRCVPPDDVVHKDRIRIAVAANPAAVRGGVVGDCVVDDGRLVVDPAFDAAALSFHPVRPVMDNDVVSDQGSRGHGEYAASRPVCHIPGDDIA
jgi:hypothetical protein